MRRLLYVVMVVFAMAPGLVAAQATPEPQGEEQTLPEALDSANLDLTYWATRIYELKGVSFTDPPWFYFTGVRFYDLADAAKAPEIAGMYLEAIYPDLEFDVVSTGLEATAQRAAVAEVDAGYVAYIAIQYSRFLIVAATAGILINPVATLVPYIELVIERINEFQPRAWQSMREDLPGLSDMPPGYAEME